MSRRHRHLRVVPVTQLPPPATASEATPAPKRGGPWPKLSAPVFPMDTWHRMRAQSALCGLRFRDGSTAAPVLTLEQARDVLAWYRPTY